jgi:hypothetical protein
MFNSTILDVVVGLIFTFLVVSLVASAATEAVASALKWRSATLLSGIKSLLNDPNFDGLAKSVYNHALVNPRGDGKANSQSDVANAPAYVDPKHFANALIDIAGITSGTPAAIKAALVGKITDPQLQQLLGGIIDRTGGVREDIRGELASWFDSAMDRVSGAYKRKTQLISFIIAFVAAVVLNVDSIRVAKSLWQQPMLTKSINQDISIAGDAVKNVSNQLNALGLPVGWSLETWSEFKSPVDWIEVLLGWLVTAFATLFGAPFWFDALQQIARLKGTGPSPAEKKTNTAAAA